MASLSDLNMEGKAGILPGMCGESGRLYSWRVRAKSGPGTVKNWNIGDWFCSQRECERLRRLLSRKEWRRYVSSCLTKTSAKVCVEVVACEFENGEPYGRPQTVKGTIYPVRRRRTRVGAVMPVVQWHRGRTFDGSRVNSGLLDAITFDAQRYTLTPEDHRRSQRRLRFPQLCAIVDRLRGDPGWRD